MKHLSAWINRFSTGWMTLAGLLIFILFMALVMPRQAGSAEPSDQEVGSPDLSFFYTPAELYKMAEAYGEQGRADYIKARFTFDLLWPLVYTLFLSTAISWLFRRAALSEGPWGWANLAPILGLLFDYAENISTSLVMYRFPAATPVFATLAPFITAIKWTFVAASFIFLIIGIIAAVWKSIRS
jgi:hypothetical protein